MEKILIGAYLSVLAAFITASASIVKLVNEKESKTTDYRQSWTDSVRVALSQLIGSISLQASLLLARQAARESLIHAYKQKVGKEEEGVKSAVTDYLKSGLSDLDGKISENRENIQKNFSLAALHFKPNDPVFARFEQKFEFVDQILFEMSKTVGAEKAGEREALKEKVHGAVVEMTGIARHILKTEWESVKAGEPAYRRTKNWSLYIGIAALSILTFSGVYMLAYWQISSRVVSSGATGAGGKIAATGGDAAGKIEPREPVEINQLVRIEQTSAACQSKSGNKPAPASPSSCVNAATTSDGVSRR